MNKLLIAMAVVCLTLMARGANASLLWGWEILNSNAVIGPNDSLQIIARLVNLPGSDRHFTKDDLGGFGIFDSELRPYYQVLDSLPGEPYQFDDFDLAPGQTFYFRHFILVPRADNPITEERTFSFDTSFVINQAKMDIVPTGFIINQYTFTVEVPGSGIPEPTSIFLMGIGLVGLLRRANVNHSRSA